MSGVSISYERVAALPALVRSFCHSHEAWIVGSGAAYLLGHVDKPPRDWDVLIHLWQWGIASKTIPKGSQTNSHGGVKVPIGDGQDVDVWAGDIGWFLAQAPAQPHYAVQPKTMTVLTSSRAVTMNKKPSGGS